MECLLQLKLSSWWRYSWVEFYKKSFLPFTRNSNKIWEWLF